MLPVLIYALCAIIFCADAILAARINDLPNVLVFSGLATGLLWATGRQWKRLWRR